VQRGPAEFPRALLDLCAKLFIGRRQGAQPLAQRLEVEHRPAHQHGQSPACTDRGHRSVRIGDEARCGVGRRRRQDIHEVVRHPGQYFVRGLRRADVHPAVDLRRVDTDDLDVESLRELQRQRGLT